MESSGLVLLPWPAGHWSNWPVTSFTRARLFGLTWNGLDRFSKLSHVNIQNSKPFQTKLTLLNKPGYLFVLGSVWFVCCCMNRKPG